MPALRRAGGGSLLFNASMVAETGSPAYPAYAAAKAGLVSLTGSLAMLLARDGIRVKRGLRPGGEPCLNAASGPTRSVHVTKLCWNA